MKDNFTHIMETIRTLYTYVEKSKCGQRKAVHGLNLFRNITSFTEKYRSQSLHELKITQPPSHFQFYLLFCEI